MARRRRAAKTVVRAPVAQRALRATPAHPAPDASSASQSPASLPFPFRDMLAVSVPVLALYIATMPRTVTLEDSGIFIMASDVAGVAHPPGYPLHSLLGKLFTLLPVGTVALRVHLLSAFFGALCCATLFWIGRALTGSRVVAFAAALAYGVSREFWAQSIIAEVYSINCFLFFLLLALTLRFVADPRPTPLRWAALVMGLGLSHHWPLLLLSFPGVAVMLWPRRREVARCVPSCIPFLLLGLTPYLYLVARSNMDPPISFYGPIDSLQRFIFFIARSGYAEMDVSPTAGWYDRLLFVGSLLRQMSLQLTPLGAALALFGFYRQWRRWDITISLGLTLAFLGGSLVLALLLQRDFGYLEEAVFKVYPLIPYGIMALWLGLGIDQSAAWLTTKWKPAARFAAPILCGLVIAGSLLLHASVNFRARYTWARDYAQAILDSLDERAILITTADSDIGPIGYLNRVEHVRPDVEIFNDKGLVFANRLFRPPAGDRARGQAFKSLIDSTDRPVYVTGDLPVGYPTEDFGLFKRIHRTGVKSVTVHPRILDFCRTIEGQDDATDMWTVEHRDVLLVDCGRLLGPAVYLGNAPDKSRYAEVLDRVSSRLYGKIGLLEGLAETGKPDDLLRWLDDTDKLIDPGRSKQATSRLLFIRGFVQNRKGSTADAIQSFRHSVEVFPDPRNGAVLALLQLYASQRMRHEYRELRDAIYDRRTAPTTVQELDKLVGK